MEEDKGTVCVTGGTGFIASWLIMRLLEHGYSVRTTVRPDPEKKRDLSFLTNLPGASEKLQIFTADLSDPDSFKAAIEGCTGVLHVATPIDFEGREPEEVLTQRTIDGTLGILKACLKSKTVKRVVYTSSVSAVTVNGKNVDVMDESFWSDVDYIRKIIPMVGPGAYLVSKTSAEKAALQFAEENGLDLVTVIPTLVVGPFVCPKFPASVRSALAMVLGNKEEYTKSNSTAMVHVDDVVRAHIFLLEYPEAKGSSLTENKGYKLPELSTKKLLDTGFKYKYGLDEIFDGAIQCCKEKGYL
ncbi:hypothetical protein EZV62_009688 [Acer yangbiense]|uniref:NAD-dependent epimerase/dehydratase domain-containing protein n=1 Tax=Acer yangbiense TaxID=1000413 RepID=A0A5C7I0W1_9ROSI|nr:hypothetical protein EZV62_009688 [Acer yangbiense]